MSICTSHSYLQGTMSCDTHHSLIHPFFKLILSDGGLGIHGSIQIWILVPKPTLRIMPFLINVKPCSIDFHVGNASLGKTVLIRSPR
jgi:hypothetical protein